jgi:hypothetical protein
MKKTAFLVLSICVTALVQVSCSNDNITTTQEENLTAVGASATVDATNEIDINTALAVTNTAAATTKSAESPVTNCTTITVSGTTYPRVFTIDYGTAGCPENQINRKGKLVITLSAPVITTGSRLTIERLNYSINGLKLEGTIVYTNKTTVATVPQWSRTLTAGKLTDLNGRIFTSFGDQTIKQTAGVDTPYVLTDNVYEMTEGTLYVTAQKGGGQSLTVLEPVVKKYSCNYISKGKISIHNGGWDGVIDYGNGDCDNKYTFTFKNGASFDLTL